MSRPQQDQTFNTATNDNATNEKTSQTAESNEANDIGTYQSTLSKFAASNPYVQGGEAATTSNQIASGTAGGNAAGTQAQLQNVATRTGQNPNAANASAVSADQASERAVEGQEADANQSRIGDEAKYNEGTLDATGKLPTMENSLASESGGQADNQLGVAQKAGDTPSWMEEFGGALAGSLGKGLGAAATSFI